MAAAPEPGLPVVRPWLWWVAGWGVLAGSALQLNQSVLWPWWAYAGMGVLGLGACGGLAWLRRGHRSRSGQYLLAALVGVMLAWSAAGLRARLVAQEVLPPHLEGQDLRVTALIAAMPQPHEAGVRLRLTVEEVRWHGAEVTIPSLVDVSWYSGAWRDAGGVVELQRQAPAFRVGERWTMTVRLKAPHGLRNPRGFDYELWTWEQGVRATGYIRAGVRDEPPQRLGSTWRYPMEQARQRVRDAIMERLLSGAGGEDAAAQARRAGVIAALVTGDQRAIDRADWDVFRATGVAHLMSISGLHITLFAWLAATALRWLWRRSAWLCLTVPAPQAGLVAGVVLAGLYAWFSGWGVPAQRTVVMLAVVAWLRWSGRRWPWPQVWMLACVAAVLADPWALLQAGFWLSFVAVAMLFATDSGASGAHPAGVRGHFYAMLREQWVVTLALTPLSLLLFGQVSVVGLLANLVAIPWVTLVVTPLALLGVLVPPLWSLAAWAMQPLALGLQWLASWAWASVHLPAAPWWMGCAAVLGGALMALRWPWPLRLMGLVLVIPALAYRPPAPAPGEFSVLGVDVGQGNAVLVRTAHHSLLYDAGPRYSRESDAGHRVVVPLLRALAVELDLLVLSHRDTDHTGGAFAVLAQQPQARLMGSLAGESQWQALRAVQPCMQGDSWEWDGVRFEVLHPAADTPAPAGRANAVSCVIRATARAGQGASALLAGDIEAAQEQWLRAQPGSLRADWLLVPHHGSKTSSTAAFLEAVQPRTALVQAGYRNRFGHPAAEVVQRYRERGIMLVESTRCGAMGWQSALPEQYACERQRQRRYWQHQMGDG